MCVPWCIDVTLRVFHRSLTKRRASSHEGEGFQLAWGVLTLRDTALLSAAAVGAALLVPMFLGHVRRLRLAHMTLETPRIGMAPIRWRVAAGACVVFASVATAAVQVVLVMAPFRAAGGVWLQPRIPAAVHSVITAAVCSLCVG